MILKEQKIEIIPKRYKILEYYRDKGYAAEMREPLMVDVEDLWPGTTQEVMVECDYCHTQFKMAYRTYRKIVSECEIQKCACKHCGHKKMSELYFLHHGVINPMQRADIREKGKKTCLEKYGVDNVFKLPEVREKAAQSAIEKYGYKTVFQDPKYQEKIKAERLEKYGVEYLLQSDEIRQKAQETFVEKYGGISPMVSEEVREKRKQKIKDKYGVDEPLKSDKVLSKSSEARFINGTCKVSKAQEQIGRIVDGAINYPVGRYNVDVLFDSNIVVEYDGGAHAIEIKFGRVTPQEFEEREKERARYIIEHGYKIIRIVNSNDEDLPDDDYREILKTCEQYLENNDYVEYNVSSKQIVTGI